MIQGSPGLEIDVVSGIELGYSYELGSGQTRIGVMTRPRKRSGIRKLGRCWHDQTNLTNRGQHDING